ncbi:MAG: hypothetical protein ACPLQO_11035 [Desulfotomaculales bacterium]|jgi:hypothetical protein
MKSRAGPGCRVAGLESQEPEAQRGFPAGGFQPAVNDRLPA